MGKISPRLFRWRRLFKYFAFAMLGFILLLAGLAVLSQTRLFKNWLRDFIMASAAKSLSARAHFTKASRGMGRNPRR